MSRPFVSPPRCIFAALVAPLALAACGQDAEVARDGDREAPADPPGSALPLSIGNPGEDAGDMGGEDALAGAINCAAALDLTSERLARMSGGGASQEIALITRARDYFAQEADREGRDRVGSATAAIARQKREKAGEPTQQAQLAIACLRRFGDAIG